MVTTLKDECLCSFSGSGRWWGVPSNNQPQKQMHMFLFEGLVVANKNCPQRQSYALVFEGGR